MTLPPLMLRIRIVEGGGKRLRLWLPLFPLWLVGIPLMVVCAPVWLVVCLCVPRVRRCWLAGPMVIGLIWSLRGLHVAVDEPDEQVLVSIR